MSDERVANVSLIARLPRISGSKSAKIELMEG